MKKKFKLIFILSLTLFLCACSSAKSLSERAIIKAVYMDYSNDLYTAALVSFTCDATTDTASVKETAQIYCGSGENIGSAVYSAEQKQSRTPFFSQNELLFLSEDAAKMKAKEIIDYFSREDAQRPNLAVFVTPVTANELENCRDNMSVIVREGERLANGKTEIGNVKKLYEFNNGTAKGFSGYLPLYSFGGKEDYCGIKSLAVLNPNGDNLLLNGNAMKLLLLLDNKLNSLEMQSITEDKISFKADDINIFYDAKTKNEQPFLDVIISGNIKAISNLNGVFFDKRTANNDAEIINSYIEANGAEIIRQTFGVGNDVFAFTWHMRGLNNNLCEDMINSGTLYSENRVRIKCKFKVI
ncbi:MAG: hypothetical protein RSF00_01910 [Oscillospiraceae bacterium]